MPKHKVEEITLSVEAQSLEESFSKLALSMFDIVIDTNKIQKKITKTVLLKSKTLNNLLFQWMKKIYELANNELFLLAAVNQMIIERVNNEYLLNSVISGDKMNSDYKIKDIIKQITDRNIEIKNNKGINFAQINIVVRKITEE